MLFTTMSFTSSIWSITRFTLSRSGQLYRFYGCRRASSSTMKMLREFAKAVKVKGCAM